MADTNSITPEYHFNFKHGHTVNGRGSPTYKSWRGMKDRCLNPDDGHYKNYKGRGITFCERWLSFENFLADMGEKPEGKTLDRFPDNNGNYEPGNCRWATALEQHNNTRRTSFIELDGQRHSVTEWARLLKIGKETIRHRLWRGLPAEQILSKESESYTPLKEFP